MSRNGYRCLLSFELLTVSEARLPREPVKSEPRSARRPPAYTAARPQQQLPCGAQAPHGSGLLSCFSAQRLASLVARLAADVRPRTRALRTSAAVRCSAPPVAVLDEVQALARGEQAVDLHDLRLPARRQDPGAPERVGCGLTVGEDFDGISLVDLGHGGIGLL